MSSASLARATVVALLSLPGAIASARAQIIVTSPSVLEHTARPGEQYSGTVDVRNTSTEAQKVNVRVVDYAFQADGTNSYDAPGSQPRSNAAWLTTSTRTLEIPPRQQATLGYIVRVPASDTLRGSYSCMVMVSAAPHDDVSGDAAHGKSGPGLHSRLSFGVQLATHLAGPATTRFNMEHLAIATTASHDRTISLTVRNTGERAQRPIMSLELYREDGQLVASRKAQRGLIYPGSSVRQEFVLTGIPAGKYRALIQADAGEDDVFALQSDVRF
jgi:hypothetical protein